MVQVKKEKADAIAATIEPVRIPFPLEIGQSIDLSFPPFPFFLCLYVQLLSPPPPSPPPIPPQKINY